MIIYIFLAEGFEEIEAIAPLDIFRRAQINTLTVSVTGHKLVSGAHNIKVEADELFENIVYTSDAVLFLPGGMPGTTHLSQHEGLKELIRQTSQKQGTLAAICAAPSILGHMGLLENREAICYPGFESKLEHAVLSDKKIVKSDNIFTAKAAGVAIEFALKLVAELKGKESADKISESIFLN